MPDAEPHRLSAAALARLVDSGELTAEAIVRSCLDRIRERDPVVRAWAWLDAEQALDAARECDKRGGNGALRGVPFGIKDNYFTADMPTMAGTRAPGVAFPLRDSACAARLRAAGAIILGKTRMHEFA